MQKDHSNSHISDGFMDQARTQPINFHGVLSNPKDFLALSLRHPRKLLSFALRHPKKILGKRTPPSNQTVQNQTYQVLFVTDIPFWQLTLGSHRRIDDMAVKLSQKFTIGVYYIGLITQNDITLLQKPNYKFDIVSGITNSLIQNLASPLIAPAYAKTKWKSDFYVDQFKQFCTTNTIHCITFHYIWTIYLHRVAAKTSITIVDTIDLMAYRKYKLSLIGGEPSVNINLAPELQNYKLCDAIIAIQSEEAKIFRSLLPQMPVLCCPMSVIPQRKIFPKPTPTNEPLRLGFIGGTSYVNNAGILWFEKYVMPYFTNSNIRLNIYGGAAATVSKCVPILNANVILRDFLDNVEDIYRECDIMINPVTAGGGLKIKSLEALQFATPLISSPEGIEGIYSGPNSGIMVAKSRSDFVTAIHYLSQNRTIIPQMSEDAYTNAVTNFNSETCYDELVQFVQTIL